MKSEKALLKKLAQSELDVEEFYEKDYKLNKSKKVTNKFKKVKRNDWNE
jgi:hypothetical protein